MRIRHIIQVHYCESGLELVLGPLPCMEGDITHRIAEYVARRYSVSLKNYNFASNGHEPVDYRPAFIATCPEGNRFKAIDSLNKARNELDKSLNNLASLASNHSWIDRLKSLFYL
jgi:hypothetical protein